MRRGGIESCLGKPVRQSQLYNCLVSLMARPADQGSMPEVIPAPEFSGQAGFPGLVLLAEDNAVNQEVALGMLDRLGCRVDVVTTGRQAVEAAARTRYDLVLMDCQMPEMDGFEATRLIREGQGEGRPPAGEAAPRPVPPIVALTAHALQGDRELCLAAGMDDYLSKPFTLDQLRTILARWLPRRPDSRPAGTPPAASGSTAGGNGDPDGPGSDAVVLDAKRLALIQGLQRNGAADLLSRMMRVFLDSAAKDVNALRGAVANRDAPALQRAAHSLKSSSGNLGALRMEARCRELETMGRANDLAEAAAALSALESDYAAVRQAIGAELEKWL
jgi:CheY-like chemotaxis protein/HPt (histidine-containing phosphotransfer) domain-containing protein